MQYRWTVNETQKSQVILRLVDRGKVNEIQKMK